MFQLVDFNAVEERHLLALAKSVMQAPADERDSPQEMLSSIKNGSSFLYELDDGIVLVRAAGRNLYLDAFCCEWTTLGLAESARRYQRLAEDLRRMAAESGCDKIKTIVFDSRLTSVIQHLGGRVESQTLVLAVETGSG